MAVSASVSRIVKDEIAKYERDLAHIKKQGKGTLIIHSEDDFFRGDLFDRLRSALIKRGAATEDDFNTGITGIMSDKEIYNYVIQEIAKSNPIKDQKEYLKSIVTHHTGETYFGYSGKANRLDVMNDIKAAREEYYKQKTDMGVAGRALSETASILSNPLEAVAGGALKGVKVAGTAVKTVVATKGATALPSVTRLTPNALGKMISPAAQSMITKACKYLGITAGSAGAVTVMASCSTHEEVEAQKTAIPQWMRDKYKINSYVLADTDTLKRAQQWSEKNAETYKKYADAQEKSGRSLKVGDTIMTPAELRERQLQYTKFATELRTANAPAGWMKEQMGIKDYSKASTETLEKAYRWSEANLKKLADMAGRIAEKAKDGKTVLYYNYGGQKHSIQDLDVRLSQYRCFCQQLDAELNKRALKNAKNNNYEAAPAFAYSAETTQASQTTQAAAAGQAQGQPQFQQMQQELQQQKFSSWGNLFKNTGLEDFINHPGMTIAMLPDMLMGMFTGKETPFGMNKGTLLPLAALFGAGFVRNPILKMILLSSAAAGILGKAATGVAQSQEQGEARYQKYPDEKLNERISNFTINGTQILMDIDGVPRSVVIPPTVADAYKQGAISENTLANAILKNYDEQSRQLAENYERQQERGVGVGIK